MIWYFAFGSNLDQDRFRERVGEWSKARPAVLYDHRLRFSGEVTSEGGGGAVVERAEGKKVYGGIYAISHEQIAEMDAVELDASRDLHNRAARNAISVDAEGDPVRAQIYEVPPTKTYRAPSATYLGHITKGLRDFGWDEGVIAEVEEIAAAEPSD